MRDAWRRGDYGEQTQLAMDLFGVFFFAVSGALLAASTTTFVLRAVALKRGLRAPPAHRPGS